MSDILRPGMKHQEVELLTQEELCNACFSPLIQAYKASMAAQMSNSDTEIKEQFYSKLTVGQKSLFSFYVYYNHAIKSLEEFYWWSAYFLAQPPVWSAIKAAFNYFEDERMLKLFERVEEVLKSFNHPLSLDTFTITREQLADNKELLACISPLHHEFNQLSPLTITIISHHIRANLNAFIVIEG